MRRERLYLILLALSYLIVFHVAYVTVIVPNFSYQGFLYRGPSLPLIGLAWVFALLPALWLPTSASRPSVVIYWILYCLAYVPSQLVPTYALTDPGRLVTWGIGLVASFLLIWLIIRSPLRKRVLSLGSPGLFWTLILLFLLGAYVVSLGTGIRVATPDLTDVYSTRFAYRGLVSEQGIVLAYMVSWAGNVINPLLMSFAIVRKRPWLFVLGLLGQVALFSLTGFKAVVFSPFLVLGLHLVAREGGLRFGRRFLTAMVGVVTLSLATYYVLNSDFLIYTFTRRVVATPGLLSGFYFDFFSQHAKTLFSHSFLSGVVSNPYGISPPFLIGRLYYGSPSTSANANLFADGFAGLGTPGMILVAVAAAFVLRVLDAVVEGRDWRLVLGLTGMLGFALSNSALSTTFVSHGLAFALVTIMFMPTYREIRGSPNKPLLAPTRA